VLQIIFAYYNQRLYGILQTKSNRKRQIINWPKCQIYLEAKIGRKPSKYPSALWHADILDVERLKLIKLHAKLRRLSFAEFTIPNVTHYIV